MKINLILVFFLLGMAVHGQVTVTNQSLTDSSLNILYIGVDNEITVHGMPPLTRNKVVVTDATIKKVGNDKYIIRPNLADTALIFCYSNDSIILRKRYKINSLPQPAVRLGNISQVMASVKEILENTTVSIYLPDCYYKHTLRPISYRFRIENDANDVKEYKYAKTNFTPQLTKEQKELIGYCLPGITIILDATKITGQAIFGETALSQLIIVK